MRGEDPCVNVVLFEDTAAVLSVILAGGCMGLSTYYNSSIPDAVGSLLVGGILGSVASFIIYSNANALVGRSIALEQLDKINSELESDVMIRAIHDVKGIDIGNSLVRYKAEMDFDGRELTRFYLEKQDLNLLLEVSGRIGVLCQVWHQLLRQLDFGLDFSWLHHNFSLMVIFGISIEMVHLKRFFTPFFNSVDPSLTRSLPLSIKFSNRGAVRVRIVLGFSHYMSWWHERTNAKQSLLTLCWSL